MRCGKFCCCDSIKPCQSLASQLEGCGEQCDTRLSANVSQCTQPYPSSFSTSVHENPSVDNLKDKFIFDLSTVPDTVSACIVSKRLVCKHTLYSYIYSSIFRHLIFTCNNAYCLLSILPP